MQANEASESPPFAGRIALVTGGASGIGRAVADRFAAAGSHVYLFDRDAAALALAVAAGNGLLHSIEGDVTRSADLEDAVRTIDEARGRLDVLVCSAGITGSSLRTLDVSDEEWRRVVEVDLDGTFFACRAALRPMVRDGYGRIVNIASIAGKEGNPQAAAYSASKAGVIALTKAIAKDVVESGVLVHSIAPAVIRTPLLDQISEEHIRYMAEKIPLGRLGTPAEVAMLVSFLCRDDFCFSTGACFDLSGGRATY
jgi:3-oxoacyl-[acyl-carrier protein] reductase